jgi:PAS domain S-box-containing protein
MLTHPAFMPNSCLSLAAGFSGPMHAELYEHSSDCIKIVNDDGSIVRLNPGGSVALELDHQTQLDGNDWPSLWPGSEQPRVEEALAQARLGRRVQFTAFCPTAKGNPRWWDVVITPMPGPDAAVDGFLVVSRDVTELVNAREVAAGADRRKDEFLSLLSHELRNPLSALSTAGQLLALSAGDPAQLAKVGGIITRQVAHMTRLAEDLLDVSRIARGEIALRKEQIDLRDAVTSALEQLDAMLLSKSQTCKVDLPCHCVPVSGDRTRLTQLVGNLVGNAIRYSPLAATIAVGLRVEAHRAFITIADNGKGISADFMPHLFTLYAQQDRDTERGSGGLGLGLSLVKSIAELHGGQVSAESGGNEQGSTFTVILPLSGPPQ